MKNKICKYCRKEVDLKATRCPQCQSDLRSWPTRHPILSFFIVIFVLSSIFTPARGKSGTSSNSDYSPTPTPDKNKIASTFCSTRSNGSSYFELHGAIKSFDDNSIVYNTTKKPVQEDCQKITEICLKKWSEDDCKGIAERKIWIGMDEVQLLLSQGNPRDKNNTTNAYGIHTQWVYGDSGYVYLEGKDEDNLKVTSWQD